MSSKHSSRSRRSCTSGGRPNGYTSVRRVSVSWSDASSRSSAPRYSSGQPAELPSPSAGAELLTRAKTILDEVDAANAAVRRVAGGEAGTVRLGVAPPAAPSLAPHLVRLFKAQAPQVTVVTQRMWLPGLTDALAVGDVDVAITCGLLPESEGLASEVFCGEPLLVGVRQDHRLADRQYVALAGILERRSRETPADLFPAWELSQRQALDEAGVTPPTVALEDTDLAAARWVDQDSVGWIMLIASLTGMHTQTVFLPVDPCQLVPFTLQWKPSRASITAVARFVQAALTADLPPGWRSLPKSYKPPVGSDQEGLRIRVVVGDKAWVNGQGSPSE